MYQPESVKLYVKPVCGWCRQAEHWLKSQGIEFDTIDVMEDPKAFEHMEQISG
ncbi:MAG: glutaredoxin family protein, partial [Verrucomicrobiota bacterium]|nr:glutaredoxin family protein [Verrucomicrobiota bacterium]MEE2812941.1 glutaredoxin family protein [Verrucomicrobiota bacterium]